jgi:hypothetical protein
VLCLEIGPPPLAKVIIRSLDTGARICAANENAVMQAKANVSDIVFMFCVVLRILNNLFDIYKCQNAPKSHTVA